MEQTNKIRFLYTVERFRRCVSVRKVKFAKGSDVKLWRKLLASFMIDEQGTYLPTEQAINRLKELNQVQYGVLLNEFSARMISIHREGVYQSPLVFEVNLLEGQHG